jgi:hypothetical protein
MALLSRGVVSADPNRRRRGRRRGAVAGADRAAFAAACRYPGGTNVLCMTVLELRDEIGRAHV